MMIAETGDAQTSASAADSRTDTTPKAVYTARYTVKGLLGKQVLYTATQEGRVMTLSVPEDIATFRATVGEIRHPDRRPPLPPRPDRRPRLELRRLRLPRGEPHSGQRHDDRRDR